MLNSFKKAALAICVLGMLTTGCVTNRTVGGGVDDVAADINLRSRLLGDNLYDYSDVDLTIYEGRLMLTGSMLSEDGKNHVNELAKRAPNVKEVLDELVISQKTTFGQGTSDALIDEKLL